MTDFSVLFRKLETRDEHVRVTVHMGPVDGTRCYVGELRMSLEDWTALCSCDVWETRDEEATP